MTTALPLLEILAAEREIVLNHARFFEIADTGEAEQFVECFTPDATIEYTIMPGPPQRFRGVASFVSAMTGGARRRGGAVAHVAGQTVVRWDGDEPHLSGYATVWHWAAVEDGDGHPRPADWTTVGRIEDDYAYCDGRWLIARRHVSRVAGLVAAGVAPA